MLLSQQNGIDVGGAGHRSPMPTSKQPSLFDLSTIEQSERDARTGDQWILAVIAYLEWRSGSAWRKLHVPAQRWSPVRWEYLDAMRIMLQARYSTKPHTCAYCAAAGVPKKPAARHLPTMEQVRRIAR